MGSVTEERLRRIREAHALDVKYGPLTIATAVHGHRGDLLEIVDELRAKLDEIREYVTVAAEPDPWSRDQYERAQDEVKRHVADILDDPFPTREDSESQTQNGPNGGHPDGSKPA